MSRLGGRSGAWEGPPYTQLVFIGPGLDAEELGARLEAAEEAATAEAATVDGDGDDALLDACAAAAEALRAAVAADGNFELLEAPAGAPASLVVFRLTGAAFVGMEAAAMAADEGVDFDELTADLSRAVNMAGGRALLTDCWAAPSGAAAAGGGGGEPVRGVCVAAGGELHVVDDVWPVVVERAAAVCRASLEAVRLKCNCGF